MPYSEEKKSDIIKKGTPDTPAKTLFKEANKLFHEKKWEDCIKIYTKVIKLDPNFSSAFFNRGLAYFLTSKKAKAKQDINSVISLQPTKADAPYIMGIILETENDFEAAKKMFNLALEKNPDHSQSKNKLLQYEETEKTKRAIHLYNEAKKSFDNGLTVEAFELMREVIKMRPENPGLHSDLGFMYANVNEYHAALSEYSLAVLYDDKESTFRNNKSYALARLGKIDEAFKEIKIVGKNNPADVLIWFTYAQIFALNADISGGLNLLKKLISSKKFSSSALCKEAKRELLESLSLEKSKKNGLTDSEKKLLNLFISQVCKPNEKKKNKAVG
jgi:tetratricopeptide (TPR) repeat protein